MTDEIIIRLPFLLPLENEQRRLHYHQKRDVKDQIIREFIAAGIRSGGTPMKYAEIVVWRHSTQRPDDGGLWGSLKQLLDVLQPEGKLRKSKSKGYVFPNPGGLSIITNDDPSHAVVRPLWVKAPNLPAQHTLVRIRRLVAILPQEVVPMPEVAE